MNAREEFLTVEGGRIWCRVVGNGSGTPLLTLHGGPGISHEYLLPLEALADERPVIFYDQLGGGRSDRPRDDSLWTVERFVRELDTVRQAFAPGDVHLLGQSWGTMMAVDYALGGAKAVRSMVLADACLSVERWAADADALIDALPEPHKSALRAGLDAGRYDAPEFLAAQVEFSRRHLCRLNPWPDVLIPPSSPMNRAVYKAMWGPTDYYATGATRGYDRTGDLGRLTMPVLYACGRYDGATPETTAWYRNLTPAADMVVFENSSHMPMNEAPEAFVRAVREFLRRADED